MIRLSDEDKRRLLGFLERGYSGPRIAELMCVSVATAKRWRARWAEKGAKSLNGVTPVVTMPLVTVTVPEPPLRPSGFIPPIPLARLMGGRA